MHTDRLRGIHCMLVRSDDRRLGGLDENMLSTRENIDFCLALQQIGEKVYLEPRSKITYLPPERLKASELPFFALRWSDLWICRVSTIFATSGNSTRTNTFDANTPISAGDVANS